MKNWKLFVWALKHCKVVDNKYPDCLRNSIMIALMNLSGVTPKDAFELLDEIKHELCQRQGLGS